MVEEFHQAPAASEHIDEAEIIRRYEEKKRLLGAEGVSREMRGVFKEAFREHVSEKVGALAPSAAAVTPVDDDDALNRQAGKEAKTELESLISLALEKGVYQAVRKATFETPYLIDALHDELADHYYDKLIAAGKLSG